MDISCPVVGTGWTFDATHSDGQSPVLLGNYGIGLKKSSHES